MNPGALPFDESRRLTGPNLFFASTGAVLELAAVAADATLIDGWRARVARARARLGWDTPELAARAHAGGATLALAAPCDQLFVATELNEWALCATLAERDPVRWRELPQALYAAALENVEEAQAVVPPVLEETAAFARLEALAAREARPPLRRLLAAAAARGLPTVLDDAVLTLGTGAGGRSYALAGLPAPDAVPWDRLAGVPTTLVTGSNGKTTSVRLIAACAAAHGWTPGYNCTDGVSVADEALATGDYSGPAGARLVLRDARTRAAILETARGGILRRGIAVTHAEVALVTNVSSDHFGEYGIDDLDGLADVKLSVAAVLGREGLLVLNADDPLLATKAAGLAGRFGVAPPIGWFALEADQPLLARHRRQGGSTAGVRDGRLLLADGGLEHDLGAIAAMPLALGGSADYNIANLAGAALAAAGLGIPLARIASVFARFGAAPGDNPGRMMRYRVGGIEVLIDYAHNAAGLEGLLRVARARAAGRGRLGLLLGHAGNRQDADLEALARAALAARPDLVVVKENEAHLRGREPGEVPRILRATLLAAGLPEAAVPLSMSEFEAARVALEWARPGDVLALPLHSAPARAAVVALLERRARDERPDA